MPFCSKSISIHFFFCVLAFHRHVSSIQSHKTHDFSCSTSSTVANFKNAVAVHLCRYEENTKHSKYAVMSLLADCMPIVALFPPRRPSSRRNHVFFCLWFPWHIVYCHLVVWCTCWSVCMWVFKKKQPFFSVFV